MSHSTIAMTLDVFSRVLPSMLREAAEKIDDLFAHSSSSVIVNAIDVTVSCSLRNHQSDTLPRQID